MNSSDKVVEYRKIEDLRVCPKNARAHSSAQILQIAGSIRRFGFTNPILVTESGEIIAGHGRVEAALKLGLSSVPTIELAGLSEIERRAYALADNKIALNSSWDDQLLAAELAALEHLNFPLEQIGFSSVEVDAMIELARDQASAAADDVERLPETIADSVTQPGDVWELGRHRLICGDARDGAVFEKLLQGEQANLIFTDPPYNMRAVVRGLAQVKHRPFSMAAGEMSEEEFTTFLEQTLGHCAGRAIDGAIAFVFMDWRHMGELLAAGRSVFTEHKNLIVWDKVTGGLGKFYRSQHELIFVFKVGTAPHTNNFGLGGKGRYRTNIWTYEGLNGFRRERGAELALHPTVKPLALVVDAIKDCSNRGDIVLDPFAGSGTTLLAAEACHRIARVIEVDPGYCDTIIDRYQRRSDEEVVHGPTQKTFAEVREKRRQFSGLAA